MNESAKVFLFVGCYFLVMAAVLAEWLDGFFSSLVKKIRLGKIQMASTDAGILEVLKRNHPFMEVTAKQFSALLNAAPEMVSLWILSSESDTVEAAHYAAQTGQFKRISMNGYYRNLFGAEYREFKVSETWENVLERAKNPYWPILIIFGETVPPVFCGADKQKIPEDATILFFSNRKEFVGGYFVLMNYVKQASMNKLGKLPGSQKQEREALEKTQNIIRGSENLIRDIEKVKGSILENVKRAGSF